jgi:sugar lactone lactonase YvrE
MTPMKTSTATLLYPAANILGEGPVWHAERKSFFWVDIEGKKLQEIKWPSKEMQFWPMPQLIGLIVPYGENALVVALQDGLAVFSIPTGKLEWLLDIEKEIKDNRPNDGKCDSRGRLWLGTMNVHAKEKAGSLYCIDNNMVTQHLSSLTISNGMAWQQDGKYFYFIDSPLYRVDRYLFDAAIGSLAFERTVVHIPEEMGMPDGMTIDAEGMLWVAQWDGFSVCRWNPHTGEMLHKIDLPIPQVSSCTFGGENLDVLFITTASVGLDEGALLQYPQSGHVFYAQPGVKGMLPNKFKSLNDRSVK